MNENPEPSYQRLIRVALACLGLLLCLFCAWTAAVAGLSRLYSAYGLKADRLDAADSAVNLTPSDPRAHLIRAALLKESDRGDEALKEYERAVALRPRDYVLWLELGEARDQMEDAEGALVALREAVRLAPNYAEPRWQLGNVELRRGRYDEAFADMRRAAASKPALLPQMIDLAWSVYRGNVTTIEQAVQPQTPEAMLTLARLAAKRGKPLDAARIFRAVGQVSEEEKRALLVELLNTKQFRTAYEIWSTGTGKERPDASASLTDGGFEETINLNDPGFGWQVAREVSSVQVSSDTVEPHGGKKSLLLDWKGDVSPASSIISQLVLVEPNARYRLRFSARTDQLVTGGLPLVVVTDPSDARPLAQSEAFAQRTSPWRDYEVEFTTGKDTQAVLIALRRQACSSVPCPVFGRVWLDDFSIQRL
jgi:tetratricopeptide (TPR) repeat protein